MNLVDRAKNIILSPKTEWPAVAGEAPNIGEIMTGYVIPLTLIPAVARVIGISLIGMPLLAISVSGAIAWGVVSFLSAVLGVYVTAYVVDFLAPNFGSEKNLGRAVQLVAYSATPGWLAGIFYIIPTIGWLASLASLYGLYLAYLGLPCTMKTPQDKVVVYLVVTIVVLIVVSIVIAAILSRIVFGIFGLDMISGTGLL